jgi:hypothetical protein
MNSAARMCEVSRHVAAKPQAMSFAVCFENFANAVPVYLFASEMPYFSAR